MKAAHSLIRNSDIQVRIEGDELEDRAIVTITRPAPRERWQLRLMCTFPVCDLLVIAALIYLAVVSVGTEVVGQIDAWLVDTDRASVDRFMNRCGAAIMLLFVSYITWACFTAYYSGAFDRLVR